MQTFKQQNSRTPSKNVVAPSIQVTDNGEYRENQVLRTGAASGIFEESNDNFQEIGVHSELNISQEETLTDDSMSDTLSKSSSKSPQHDEIGCVDRGSSYSNNSELDDAPMFSGSKKVLLDRLHEAATRGSLSLINFSRRGLRPKDALLLKRVIVNNPHLSVLKLGYNNLGDSGAYAIASAILKGDSHHHLSVLDLGFNGIGDTGCESLVLNAVAGNFHLRTLYLSGNNIGQKGALSIAGAILHGCCLSALYLSGTNIGPIGVKAISAAITECEARTNVCAGDGSGLQICRIEQLDFGCTAMNSVGFIGIPNMMLSNNSLRVLCLASNGIDDRDISLFSQAISQSESIQLEALHLSFNQITCIGVECLMNAMWGSKSLRVMKLDNNKIQDRGAQLCAVVLASIGLVALDLSFNRVTAVGIRALMKSISENTSLLSVAICGIPVDQNASKAVSYALAYNQTLRSFYMDNCSAGYSTLRHIVAGIVSNRSGSLRVLTGFPLGPITVTLGMPQLPESWSNDQVLGFVRLMWQQWRQKEAVGADSEDLQEAKGPAPPAAVAAAAKIAFSTLGESPEGALHSEPYEREFAETSPLIPPNAALLERTLSGTLRVPAFHDIFDGDIPNTIEAWSEDFRPDLPTHQSLQTIKNVESENPLENRERRNKNLRWLCVNYRSLNDIGQLPFNNADLWQLHQYYFSPPHYSSTQSDVTAQSLIDSHTDQAHQTDIVATLTSNELTGIGKSPTQRGKVIISHDETCGEHHLATELRIKQRSLNGEKSLRTTQEVLNSIKFPSLGHAISFQALNNAVLSVSTKRKSDDEYNEKDDSKAKRARKPKPRISYYPRIKARLESLGAKPLDETLSLLRKLKYIESILFPDNNAYDEFDKGDGSHQPVRSDVEMILIDLL